jgi:hypothetical protein
MNALLDQLALADLGLVITVDEVNPEVGELVSFVSTYQHFVRERRNVALHMAGLPNNVSSLLGNDDVSFLRRASQRRQGDVKALCRRVSLAGRKRNRSLRQSVPPVSCRSFRKKQAVGYKVRKVALDGSLRGGRRGYDVGASYGLIP